MESRRNCDIAEFLILLEGWITEIHQKYGDDDKHEAFVSECDDYYGCLKVISEKAEDAKGVYKIIDEYFVDSDEIADNDDSVILASGHRSKGLEFERVVVLRPDLMPHPGAKTDADRQQEANLEYVIYTRGKQELIICFDREPV